MSIFVGQDTTNSHHFKILNFSKVVSKCPHPAFSLESEMSPLTELIHDGPFQVTLGHSENDRTNPASKSIN